MAEIPNGFANAVGNNVHEDLTMTRYPEAMDKRGSNKTGGNENLNTHKNLEDYNMAEHVNALADSVMAIQRALGIQPQLSTSDTATGAELYNLLRTKTVKSRFDTLENKNFDDRYGGPNWKPEDKQTLEEHKHTGEKGHPTKINLNGEVQGVLPVNNVDLRYNQTSGLTGAKISINGSKSDSIDKVVADKLSRTEGGTIDAGLITKGTSWTRWGRDYDVTNLTGDKEIDNEAFAMATYKSTNAKHTFLDTKFDDLYFGRYVLIVRAKTNTLLNADLIKVSTTNPNGGEVSFDVYKGNEFTSVNTWQNFYFVLDHNAKTTNKNGSFKIEKLATASAVKVSLDYAIITPVHPAIFDR